MPEKDINKQYVIFSLGKQNYGIDVMDSREIITTGDLTFIPEAPSFVDGVINLRDQIIPIVDLGKKMNLKSETDKNKVIIISMQNVLIGLLVEDILEIKKIDKINKANALKASQKVNIVFIEGILSFNEKLIIVINMKKLFDDFNLEINLD